MQKKYTPTNRKRFTPKIAPQKDSDLIFGIHPTQSLLKNNPERINHIIFTHNSDNPRLFELQKIAKNLKIKTHQLPPQKLNYYSKTNHQGVICFCNARTLDTWEETKKNLLIEVSKDLAPQVALLSNIEDPRNLGSCLRSCLALGISTVILPNKGTCGLTSTASKTSSGASEQLCITRIHDIEKELQFLKGAGFFICGIEKSGSLEIHEHSFTRQPTIYVLGGEDKGISPHIKRNCNQILTIPMSQQAHSYNASIALSLFLYEAQRQQSFRSL